MSKGDFSRPKNRIVGGVCAGIAKATNLDSLWVRLIFLVLTIVTGIIFGVVVYAVLWAVMPED